jgi:WD40 repeat protein
MPISPDGNYLLIMPGEMGESNGEDPSWVVELVDLRKEERMNLEGHVDSIMWTGFSSSGALIMTASWERQVKLWSAESGAWRCKYTWETKQQNWTACFAPSEEWVVATSGDGMIHCWSTMHGEKLWELSAEKLRQGSWQRAVAVSADERWLIVGGDSEGFVGIIDLMAEIQAGKRKWASSRLLGPVAS